jgi:hypothetical protein
MKKPQPQPQLKKSAAWISAREAATLARCRRSTVTEEARMGHIECQMIQPSQRRRDKPGMLLSRKSVLRWARRRDELRAEKAKKGNQ